MEASKRSTRTKRPQPDIPTPLPPPLAPPLPPPAAPHDDAPHKGLVCGKCGCKEFITVRTRELNANKLRRTKRCRFCGRRVHTEERITREFE